MSLTDEDKIYLQEQLLNYSRQLFAALNQKVDSSSHNLSYTISAQLADIRRLLMSELLPANPLVLETEHPVAVESNDHTSPWGTKNDNTRSARFCRACETHFGRQLAALDLGCSGGGLVFDFLVRGHLAVGLEGSDYSLKTQRAEWATIGDYLFTCDISKPFTLRKKAIKKVQEFDVISMWEVLEHIETADLPQFFSNVKRHLTSDGIFVGSIALQDDINAQGINYHRTVKPEAWWRSCFEENGLVFIENRIFDFYDFCRGTGNGPMDHDFSKDPKWGFHFVAMHQQ